MRKHPWHDTILREWVGLVLEVVNSPASRQSNPALHAQLQSALQDVIRGGSGAPREGPLVYPLPKLGFTVHQHGGTTPWVDRPHLPERGPHFDGWLWVIDGHESEVQAIAKELQAVVIALATDPRARLLRQCDLDSCRRFYIARADHRRSHNFCSAEHRRSFDLAHRDPKEAAAYMRAYRKKPAVRRRALHRKRNKREK